MSIETDAGEDHPIIAKKNRTIDDYLDAALEALANVRVATSDRELSILLGLGPTAVSNYRTKRAWPSERTMIHIAQLGIMPEHEALIDLNLWKQKDPEVLTAYTTIKKMMNAWFTEHGKTPFVIALAFSSLLQAAPASAERMAHNSTSVVSPLYIMRLFAVRSAASCASVHQSILA